MKCFCCGICVDRIRVVVCNGYLIIFTLSSAKQCLVKMMSARGRKQTVKYTTSPSSRFAPSQAPFSAACSTQPSSASSFQRTSKYALREIDRVLIENKAAAN